jgi:hypothetical protein
MPNPERFEIMELLDEEFAPAVAEIVNTTLRRAGQTPVALEGRALSAAVAFNDAFSFLGEDLRAQARRLNGIGNSAHHTGGAGLRPGDLERARRFANALTTRLNENDRASRSPSPRQPRARRHRETRRSTRGQAAPRTAPPPHTAPAPRPAAARAWVPWVAVAGAVAVAAAIALVVTRDDSGGEDPRANRAREALAAGVLDQTRAVGPVELSSSESAGVLAGVDDIDVDLRDDGAARRSDVACGKASAWRLTDRDTVEVCVLVEPDSGRLLGSFRRVGGSAGLTGTACRGAAVAREVRCRAH